MGHVLTRAKHVSDIYISTVKYILCICHIRWGPLLEGAIPIYILKNICIHKNTGNTCSFCFVARRKPHLRTLLGLVEGLTPDKYPSRQHEHCYIPGTRHYCGKQAHALFAVTAFSYTVVTAATPAPPNPQNHTRHGGRETAGHMILSHLLLVGTST